IICGTCGWRMRPSYRHAAKPQYNCVSHVMEVRAKTCCNVNAGVIDDLGDQQGLHALEPASLELSLQAEADVHRERSVFTSIGRNNWSAPNMKSTVPSANIKQSSRRIPWARAPWN